MTFIIYSSQIINSLILNNFVVTVVLWNKPLLSSCNKKWHYLFLWFLFPIIVMPLTPMCLVFNLEYKQCDKCMGDRLYRIYVLLKKIWCGGNNVSFYHDSPIVTCNVKCVTVLVLWTNYLSRQVYQYCT